MEILKFEIDTKKKNYKKFLPEYDSKIILKNINIKINNLKNLIKIRRIYKKK